MFLSLSFVIIWVISVDITDQTYRTRHVIQGTTNFFNCCFQDCHSSSRGGGLYLEKDSAFLGLFNCYFVNCRSSTDDNGGGGGFCAWCHSFSMSQTMGFNCSATEFGAFCEARFSSSAAGTLQVYDASAVFCRGDANTFEFGGSKSLSISRAEIDSLNSSLNQASRHGSGFDITTMLYLSLHYSILLGNTPSNCVYFSNGIKNNDISCLTLVNNSCQSQTLVPGFIDLRSTMTLLSCVFQLNKFDYFLGIGISVNANIWFIRCVFDFQLINKTRSVSFLTTNCFYVTQLISLVECITQSPTSSQIPSVSHVPTIRNLSVGAIAGIVIAAVLVVGVVGVLCYFICCRGRKEKPELSIIPLTQEQGSDAGSDLCRMDDTITILDTFPSK